MKRKRKRGFLATMVALAMAAELFLPQLMSAQASPSMDGYTATDILAVTGLSDKSSESYENGAFNGYIQTNMDSATLGSDYLYVEYTLDGTVETNSDSQILNFQPFNTSWGGWDNNYVTLGASDYDSSTGVYSFSIKTEKIIASLSSGTIYGINLCFAADYGITIKGYWYLNESSGDDSSLSEEDYQLSSANYILNITGTDLVNAGYDYDALQALIDKGNGTVSMYVHISEANEYSWLQSRSGSVNSFNGNASDAVADAVGYTGASNKYLIAKSCTKQSSSYYAIKYNSDGTANGSVGTGNYVFPSNAITTSKIKCVENYSVSIAIRTSGTTAEPLGLVFSDGTSFTVNEDGSLSLGFTVPTCENADTVFDEEEGSGQVWDQTAEEQRANLKLTLDYINNSMDSSNYTEDSWAALMTALETAQAVYDDATLSADAYKSARDTLENVKANLIFDTETDDSGALAFRELDQDAVIAEMGVGINLGNTMDGHSGFTPSETAWQSVVTTKEYIQALHDAGYNTVRIPVTWGTMIDDENDYKINENWMNRVQDIVDYCIEQDMYVIINIHHDGAENTGWLYVGADDIDSVMEKFEAVWRQIAETFKDYDEHLIFESMNEITCGDSANKNATEAVNYDTPIIVNFNQLFVNVVRSTGSNNTKRYLAVVSHYANNGSSSLFTMPNDTYNDTNRLMFALHVYSSSGWDGVVTRLQAVASKFTSKGIPCYLGEYGVTNGTSSLTESGYNDIYRALYSEVVGMACQVAGVVPVVWDQGYAGTNEYETGIYAYWNRQELRPIFQSIVDAMMRGTFLSPSDSNGSYDFDDIIATYASNYATYDGLTEITSLMVSSNDVTMELGERTTLSVETSPSDVTDVVLWSTADDEIATVYNGMIHAVGIGTTTVYAYAQNGTVEQAISVTVMPSSDDDVTITTDADTYTVDEGKSVFIDASASNEGTLTFESSNTDVATVSSLGKIVGISVGEAYITITADSGQTKTVKVIVTDGTTTGEITIGLLVYYNDDSNSYWSIETGDSVTVTEEGTYTLTFDCATDLSAAAIAKGVSSLSNLTAIYLEDLAVLNGDATVSALESCDITWDKIVVNGDTELTITSTETKSALKSNGVFDTNNPVNAWDGSAVAEVSADSNHVANFTTSTTPTSISITFTLTNLVFTAAAEARENPATGLTAVSDTELTICPETVPTTVTLTVKVSPEDTDTLVSFVSADKSIAQVDRTALAADDSGEVSVEVSIVGVGETTITAMTENGYTVTFTLLSGHNYEEVSRVEPEIGVEGSVTYECTDCGDTYTVKLDALEEDSGDDETDDTEPESTVTDDTETGDSGSGNTSVDETESGDSDSNRSVNSPKTGETAAAGLLIILLFGFALTVSSRRRRNV